MVDALRLMAATLAVWWFWLGRDDEYQIDPLTGVSSGPYEAWQVAGCVLSLAVIAVVGGILSPPWMVAPVVTLTFTVAWSLAAASSDETGLWVVGAVLVFVGLGFGSAALSTGAWIARSVRRRRRLGGTAHGRPADPAEAG